MNIILLSSERTAWLKELTRGLAAGGRTFVLFWETKMPPAIPKGTGRWHGTWQRQQEADSPDSEKMSRVQLQGPRQRVSSFLWLLAPIELSPDKDTQGDCL